MRKLAIIGTSNAVMKNGYGDLLKLRLTNDVDNFSIGAHSSLLAVYRIITEKIIDNYEYVLIDFSLNETHYINAKMHNFFYIISYLVFICNKFEKSKSILVFLILPSVCYSCDKSVSYIYRAFADIYRIPVIDIELSLKIFPSHNLGRKNDLVHFNDYIQSYIANEIIKFCIKKQNNIKCRNLSQEDINFFILDRSILENISKSTELMHTSLLSRNTYNVEENIIKIPTNLFLVGVMIAGNELPYFYYVNKKLRIKKNLSHIWKGAYLRTVGYSQEEYMPKGGVIFFTTKNIKNFYYEKSHGEKNYTSEKPITAIVDIILSSCNLHTFGKNFYEKNIAKFEYYKNENKIYNKKNYDIGILKATAIMQSLPDFYDYQLFINKVQNQTLNFYIDIAVFINDLFPIGRHKISILDIGSRTGCGANLLGQLYNKNSFSRINADVYASDIDGKFKKYSDIFNEFIIRYFVQDIESINYKFDIIVASDVIEFVDNPILFIDKLKQKCKQYIIILAPFMEKQANNQLIPAHIYNLDRNFIQSLNPINLKIFYSNVWHQSPLCLFAISCT